MATTITHTLKSSGGDYTSIAAWEAAQNRDLVSADEIAVLECFNHWGTGLDEQLVIDGWTTDSNRFVKITVPQSERRTTYEVDSGFWLNWTGSSNTFCVDNRADYTIIEHIGVKVTSGWRPKGFSLGNNVKGSTAKNICCEGQYQAFFVYSQNVERNKFINCVGIVNTGTNSGHLNAGFYTEGWSSAEYYNCTGFCTVTGVYGYGFVNFTNGTTDKVKYVNCVAHVQPTNTTFKNPTYYSTAGSGYNAGTNGSTATNIPGANNFPFDILDSDFTNVQNKDFTLSAASQLINVGFDLSGDFTDDNIGTLRAAPWDIGAYEIASAGGGSFNVNFGGTTVTKIYFGNTIVTKKYLGNVEI